MRIFVGLLVLRGVKSALYGQGTGRFTDAEVDEFRHEIWQGLEDLLQRSSRQSKQESADSPFWCLGGREPSEADISLYSFINSMIISARWAISDIYHEWSLTDPCYSTPASAKLVRSLPAVMDYANRIHDRYFPDYQKWE